MIALVVAAVLGFAWMGEGGAVVFALLGLWGSQGAARPWRLGGHSVVLLTAVATLFPVMLWLIGSMRPDFAQAVLDAFPQAFERALGLTMADGRADATLAQAGQGDRLAPIRLGVGACWLCALPTAAAIVLWADMRPPQRFLGDCSDPRRLLFSGAFVLIALSVFLFAGFGFGPGRHSLAFGLGVLLYPGALWLWLASVAVLRACSNWWFAPSRSPGGLSPKIEGQRHI